MKKLLENAEMRPSPGVWDRIEQDIPVRSTWSAKYKYAAAILFLLSSSLGTFLVFDHYLKNGGGDIKSRSTNYRENENLKTLQKSQNPPTPKTYTTTIVSTNKDVFNKPVQSVKKSSVKSLIPDVKSGNAAEVVKSTNEADEIKTASDTKITSGSASSLLASSVYSDQSSNPDQVAPELTENTSTSNSVSVTSSLNLKEYNRIREEELFLVSVEPVKNTRLPNTGKNIIASLLPAPVELANVLKDPTDKESLMKAHAKKLKHQQKMSQFKIYDVVRGFHIGAFFGFNTSWLTRKNDHREMEHNSIKSRAHFGFNYGIVLGYDYTERWGLQLELAIQSMQGMRYDEFCPIRGLSHKQLNLGYLKFPLLVKYKLAQVNRPDSRPIVMSVLAGPQFSILHKKELTVDGEVIPINKAIINHSELGIQTGFDMDFYLHKNMYLTLGARMGMNSPLQKTRPMSFQFGILTQFNFRKPPKE